MGYVPLSQMSFSAASPTFAAPARSPEPIAVLMASQVSPKIRPMSLKAAVQSSQKPDMASAQMSHAPVSLHTAAATAASAAPTRKAGEVIAAQQARATVLVRAIAAVSRWYAPTSSFTAATGARTTNFITANTVLRVPTAKAIALNATPSATSAAPVATTIPMTLRSCTTSSLWDLAHSATPFSILEILSMKGARASPTMRPTAICTPSKADWRRRSAPPIPLSISSAVAAAVPSQL